MSGAFRGAGRLLGPLGLAALLWGTAAAAQSTSGKPREPAPTAAPDAGHREPGKAPPAHLSPEDQEVVENLELLENLEQSDDLDLLMELSKDD